MTWGVTEAIRDGGVYLANQIDGALKDLKPSTVVLGTAAATAALYKGLTWWLSNRRRPDQAIPPLLLSLPPVRKKFQADMSKLFREFQEAAKTKSELFTNPAGIPLDTIPEEGLSPQKIADVIKHFYDNTAASLKPNMYSGMLYSLSAKVAEREFQLIDSQEGDISSRKAKVLQDLFTMAFRCSYQWNLLHGDDFPAAAQIVRSVVNMVASSYGGDMTKYIGVTTSGGTESLMTAAKAYVRYGREALGHMEGTSVILAPESIHAALMKAEWDYDFELVLIPTLESGALDLDELESQLDQYRSVVAVFGSAPSYPTGMVDPIKQMATIAQEHGVGFHCDSCLGAFVENFQDEAGRTYLQFPGVTSLSADPHKNGKAPKGVSVLICQDMPNKTNLFQYAVYPITTSSIGLYATPKLAGSESIVSAFNALIAMLAIGKKGYRQNAQQIHRSALALARAISTECSGLRLIAEPKVNVVPFKIDEQEGLMQGATYAFADFMEKNHHIHLNKIAGDRVHYCITEPFFTDPQAIEKFKTAANDSMEKVRALNAAKIAKGEKFSGTAGTYVKLAEATDPDLMKLGLAKWLEMKLVGNYAAITALRAYVMGNASLTYMPRS